MGLKFNADFMKGYFAYLTTTTLNWAINNQLTSIGIGGLLDGNGSVLKFKASFK